LADSSKCRKCGMEVHVPVKVWTMKPKRRGGPALRIALYECPKCRSQWREVRKLQAAELPK